MRTEDFRIRFNRIKLYILNISEGTEILLEEYLYEPFNDECFPEVRCMSNLPDTKTVTICFIKLEKMKLYGLKIYNYLNDYAKWSYQKNDYLEFIKCELVIKGMLYVGFENNSYIARLIFFEDIPRFRIEFIDALEIAFI